MRRILLNAYSTFPHPYHILLLIFHEVDHFYSRQIREISFYFNGQILTNVKCFIMCILNWTLLGKKKKRIFGKKIYILVRFCI